MRHSKEEWTWEQEMEYLCNLVRTGGDENVSKIQIPSYIATQAAMAKREGCKAFAKRLLDIAKTLEAGEWDKGQAELVRLNRCLVALNEWFGILQVVQNSLDK